MAQNIPSFISLALKTELLDEVLEYWINHNYLVAQGLKNSVEWLDNDNENSCDL